MRLPKVFCLSVALSVASCNNMLEPNLATQLDGGAAARAAAPGMLADAIRLSAAIDSPSQTPVFSDPAQMKQQEDFLNAFFADFPETKESVSQLYAELEGSAGPDTRMSTGTTPPSSGSGINPPPLGGSSSTCTGNPAPPGQPPCPRVCAFAAAVAAASVCASAQATACVSCPAVRGQRRVRVCSRAWRTQCAWAFGYGFGWACTGGAGGNTAGSGNPSSPSSSSGGSSSSVWNRFAGGALSHIGSNNASGSSASQTPRPMCAVVEE